MGIDWNPDLIVSWDLLLNIGNLQYCKIPIWDFNALDRDIKTIGVLIHYVCHFFTESYLPKLKIQQPNRPYSYPRCLLFMACVNESPKIVFWSPPMKKLRVGVTFTVYFLSGEPIVVWNHGYFFFVQVQLLTLLPLVFGDGQKFEKHEFFLKQPIAPTPYLTSYSM